MSIRKHCARLYTSELRLDRWERKTVCDVEKNYQQVLQVHIEGTFAEITQVYLTNVTSTNNTTFRVSSTIIIAGNIHSVSGICWLLPTSS